MTKPIDRRTFVKATAAATGVSFSGVGCQTRTLPNILWIISEDTSPDLGCYGHPLVKSPNLDRLASEGVRFSHAFATAPVCSPARSTLNTGMYQVSIGCHQHRTRNKQPLPTPVKTVSALFRDVGYFSCNASGLDFDEVGKTDWNFTLDYDAFNGTDWRQRSPGQPFFAQVNLRLTHRDFERDPQNPIDPDQVTLPPIYPDHPLLRRDWADYLESIQVLDRQIGQVLRRLDGDGLAENTVVFYFGDHGAPHLWAKQWLYDGGIRVPFMVRWPGHIQGGLVDKQMVSLIDVAATSLGLAGVTVPTWMQGRVLFGADPESRSHVFAARDRCDETVDRIRCVRDERYKYIRNLMPELPYTQFNAYKTNQYPAVPLTALFHARGQLSPAQERFFAPTKPDEELYDTIADPYETVNLAGDPAHAETLDRLRSALHAWMEQTGDRDAHAEDPAELSYWEAEMAAYHRRNMDRKGLPLFASPEAHVAWWERELLTPG